MKQFMEPESVALIGLSRKTGPGSYNIMENMIRFGYKGKIFPVNPNARSILGKNSYSNIREIKEPIDLAVISAPREDTITILNDCAQANIKSVIIVNQGFSDADKKGKEIQNEIKEIGTKHGIRILGPNTLGILNNYNNFTTSFMPLTNEKSSVGLICQSGILFVGAEDFSGSIGKGIDLGNACDIGFYEALKYFQEDPDIKIIAIHMEGLGEGKEFLSLAHEVAKKKPIILLKTALTETSIKSAMSHTGNMAGNFQIHESVMKQAGIVFLEEDGQMKYAVKTLCNMPALKGSNIAVITFSGAAGIMVTDALEKYGLKLSTLSHATINKIAKLSPDWMPLGNPLDIWPAVMKYGAEKVYAIALEAALSDPQVDGVVCISIAPLLPDFSFLDVSESLNATMKKQLNKPVVAWLYGPNTEEISKKFESDKKIMTYPTLETAAWSLSILKSKY